jgi:hypothetical protein
MKNQEVWDFANKYNANTFVWSGLITSLIALLAWKLEETDFVLVNLTLLLLGIGVSIFLTEKALKQNFDESGTRKSGF